MACARGSQAVYSKPLRQQRILFGRKMRPKMVVWNRLLIEAPTKNTLSRGLFRVWPSRRPIWIFANWGFAAKRRGLLGPSGISPLLSDFFRLGVWSRGSRRRPSSFAITRVARAPALRSRPHIPGNALYSSSSLMIFFISSAQPSCSLMKSSHLSCCVLTARPVL